MTTIRKGTALESALSLDPSDLPAGTMLLSATQTVTGLKSFQHGTLLVKSTTPADTMIHSGATSNQIVTFPDASGTVMMVGDAIPWGDVTDAPTTLAGYGITDAQPLDATLTALAGVTVAADKLIYATGADAFATCDLTAAGRAILDDANAVAQRATLGAGDASGPGSSTDNGLPRFDGTGGKTLQASAASVDDDGEIRTAINSGACPAVLPSTVWLMLTADYTLTNTGSAQKAFDTTANGRLTLPTGVYEYEAFLYLTGMSGTSGNLTWSPVGSGTATTDRWAHQSYGLDNNSPLGAGNRTGTSSVTSSISPVISNNTGTGMVATVRGVFRISAGGTLIPSVTLATAIAAVMKAGSYLVIKRIGDSGENYVGAWD